MLDINELLFSNEFLEREKIKVKTILKIMIPSKSINVKLLRS